MAKKAKTKEQIYDEQVSPLMSQVIAICKANKIPVVASFGLGIDGTGEYLHCTTAITPPEFDPSDLLIDLNQRIYPPPRSPLMITTRDGDGKVIRMEAIL